VNVAGRKRWQLLPPAHTDLLYDRFGRELAPCFDLSGAAAERFPNLAAAQRHVIEVTQACRLPSAVQPNILLRSLFIWSTFRRA
jgi:hypothetical protein